MMTFAMRLVVTVLIAAIGASASSCGDCAGLSQPAVDLTIRDAITGAAIARGSTVYLFKRPLLSPVDSAFGQDSLHISAGDGRDGQFEIIVERPGYFPWSNPNVVVGTDGSCSTETVFLEVRMRPRT
jgi:hypothetical protein